MSSQSRFGVRPDAPVMGGGFGGSVSLDDLEGLKRDLARLEQEIADGLTSSVAFAEEVREDIRRLEGV